MIVRNDCLQEDTLTVEINGFCTSIDDILSQTPVIDCDNLLVCIGPYFVNLETLINEVYSFIQDSNNSTLNNFHLLYSQYQNLYNFFMKCCMDLNNKLTNIQNRLDKMVIVKNVVVKEPSYCYQKSNKPKFVCPPPRPQVIICEEFIIDQTLTNGYMDSIKIYTGYGWTFNIYGDWLIRGSKRKLLARVVPYRPGTPEATNFISGIVSLFNEYNLDIPHITYFSKWN